MNSTFSMPTRGLTPNLFYLFFITLFSISFSFQSCNPAKGMPAMDTFSMDQNEIIKNQVLSLMKKGGKNYVDVASDVMSLKNTITDQISYERDRGENNMKTVQMWETMMDPNQNLLGGFLNRWENDGKLNGVFIKEAARVVGKNFDKIISLEKKKKKA
jgi:hypothetical protein